MNVADLYLKLFLLVVLPLLCGMAFSKKPWSGAVSSRLFALALYAFQTSVAFLAVWNARLVNNAWALPFIALAGWFLSMAIGLAAQPFMRHDQPQRGAFLFTLCLSNHGYTLLDIVALVVFGEAGLAQATYTQLLIIPFLILVCFPVARHFGGGLQPGTVGQLLKQNLVDKRNLPLVAMLAGLVLNASGIPRPAVFGDVVHIAVYLGTLVSGVAVGLLFKASHVLAYKKENLFSIVYRSTLYPLFFFGAARLFNLNPLDTVILVLFGIVPSAIFSNLIADLFHLDKNLANSVYLLSTTLFLIVVLPVYLLAVATTMVLS
ncbi:AEC family transporter [Pontiella sp.]|uniref:AEC family transporter n=1 Tax=Pontiella sp. TaxID=2837462 RepID=UPI0035693F1B